MRGRSQGSPQSGHDLVPSLSQLGGSVITLLLLQQSVRFPTVSKLSTAKCFHNLLVKFGPVGPSGNAYTCTDRQNSAIRSVGYSSLLLWGSQLRLPAHLSTDMDTVESTNGSVPTKLKRLWKE